MQFGKRKGQAFETMMLVISVIVALAILGVLLNILGIIGGGTIGSDPKAVMTDNLRNLQSKGFGTTPPKSVEFSEEQFIYKKDLTADLPISDTNLYVACAGTAGTVGENAVCSSTANSDLPIVISATGTIHAKKKIKAVLVTCANEQNTGTAPVHKYCVLIGAPGTEADTTAACTGAQGCKLE